MITIISRTSSITHDSSEGLEDVRRELERGARLNQRGDNVVVSFSILFSGGRVYGRRQNRPVTVELYRDRGQRPALVLEVAEESGSLHQALRYLVGQRRDVDELGEIVRVEMTLTPPRPDTRQRAA